MSSVPVARTARHVLPRSRTRPALPEPGRRPANRRWPHPPRPRRPRLVTERIEARAELYRQIKSLMARDGLKKVPREQRFARQVTPDAIGYVSVGSSAKKTTDNFWIELSVGVVNPGVEELIAGWTRTPPSTCTVHANIGNLPPAPGWWDVRLATRADVPTALDVIAAAYREKARPFLDECGDPLYLAALIEAGLAPRRPLHERLPVLYAQAGDLTRAAEAFKSYEAEQAAAYSPDVRAILFSQGFRDHFGTQLGLTG